MMKQLEIASLWVFAVTAAGIGSLPAFAQTVYCTNCSSETTQLLNLIRLIEQLTTQNNHYQLTVTNTQPFNTLQWGSGSNNVISVNALLAGSGSPSFANPGAAGQYNNYNGYLNTPANSTQAAANYQRWSTNTNTSASAALKAGNLQSSQMTGSEATTINNLKSQAQSAQGNLQELQVIAQIGILNAQMMQSLRQSVLTGTSLNANGIQTQSDKTTAQQAAWRNFLTTQNTVPTSGGQRF